MTASNIKTLLEAICAKIFEAENKKQQCRYKKDFATECFHDGYLNGLREARNLIEAWGLSQKPQPIRKD